MRDFKPFLKDILNSIISIEEFIKSMTYTELIEDDKTSSAVLRKLEVIGEATKHIPENIRSKYPQIPWNAVAGLRDKLIHGYFEVDYNLVWGILKKRLPELKQVIKKIMNDYKVIDKIPQKK